VHVTGKTLAAEPLIADVTKRIATLGKEQLHCDSLEAIAVMYLPPNLVRDQVKAMAAPTEVSVEGWTSMLCGKRYLFLVNFWPGPGGTTGYAVELLGLAEDQSAEPPTP
jgi:hypothetical protein